MASTRMNKEMREAILNKLLIRAFSEELGKLADRETALAAEVYDDCYNQHDRNVMSSLKDGWLRESEILQVNFYGSRVKLGLGAPRWECFTSCVDHKLRAEVKRVPELRRFPQSAKANYDSVVGSYAADHEFSKKFLQLDADMDDLAKRINKHAAEARAVLNRVTTVQKLVKVWPEVEPLATHWMRDEAREIVTGLPAVQMDQLNEALRLPPGDKEAA